jgi:tetratricopeptide (TPR) repeat protein
MLRHSKRHKEKQTDPTIVNTQVGHVKQTSFLGLLVSTPLRILITFIVVVLLVLLGVYIFRIRPERDQASINAAMQSQLESAIATALTTNNGSSTIVTDATQLISGPQKGTYTLSQNELANLHIEKANALSTLQQYKEAVAEYQAAVKMNSSLSKAALEGEIQDLYALGERQQLIPLYNQLIALEQKSNYPLASALIQQYQGNIQSLENNQGLSF